MSVWDSGVQGLGFLVESLQFMIESLWCVVESLWSMVESLWFMVESLWFIVESFWFMVGSLWFMVESLWFMVESLWFMVESLWCMVESLGCRVTCPPAAAIDPAPLLHPHPFHLISRPISIYSDLNSEIIMGQQNLFRPTNAFSVLLAAIRATSQSQPLRALQGHLPPRGCHRRCAAPGEGFRVQISGFRVQGL